MHPHSSPTPTPTYEATERSISYLDYCVQRRQAESPKMKQELSINFLIFSLDFILHFTNILKLSCIETILFSLYEITKITW